MGAIFISYRRDDPGDFVRLEIVAALRRRIAVVPDLVQGAKTSAAAALPAELGDLAFRNAVERRCSSRAWARRVASMR